MVHSAVLVLASPVFETMLGSPMQEGSEDEIKLPGKTHDEFTAFYKSLHISTMEPLTPKTAMLLSRWADEYQVGSLMAKCEEYLIFNVAVDVAGFEHAVKYHMQKRISQCIDEFKTDVGKHVDALSRLAVVGMEAHLRAVWPALCTKANIAFFPTPAPDQVRAMW
eukprot:CAMPEP_0198517124 /NCGR_PEP_ID=MMETSP1462-20131121/18341_1 /TAXON_ID=1333877 /ORGANISM="Brandtodinium nutriculum, Strain RCC3387" /LENGTH=164 /DNA_ID=CAMNT_0044246675 /DNA_START=1 /DNA_END=492 /DNA_ORIENTATION=+